MELVSQAVAFAVQMHDGMRRKASDLPYILHPMEAAVIVASLSSKPEVIAAAVLHDVVEDTPATLAELEERFGARVAALVGAETEDKRIGTPPAQSWRIRKEESIDFLRRTTDIDAKIIYLGDKLANMRAIYTQWQREGDAMFQIFNQTDPAQQGWYYRTIADNLRELETTPAWREYNKLIQIVFEKGEDI